MTTVRDGGMAISRKISSAALDPRQVQRVGHTAGVPPTPVLCTFAPVPVRLPAPPPSVTPPLGHTVTRPSWGLCHPAPNP